MLTAAQAKSRQDLRALVVDESALSRSVLTTMLRGFGVGAVSQVTRPEEALRTLRGAALPFDLIVCDYHFTPKGRATMTGQDLLDDLRQSRGLPMMTAFVMVTDEARYQSVAESVEGALDDYLLKPLSQGKFEDRLSIVLERKTALTGVFAAIESGEYDKAAALCELIFGQGGKHKLYAARIGSELYLRLRRFDAAQRMFEAVVAAKAVPWARLGIAQVQLELHGAKQASRSLETLLVDNPSYADAYDVLGRAQVEEGHFDKALQTFAKAIELTPGNVRRQQKHGALAFILGHTAAAKSSLEAAVNLGANTRSLDYQTLVLQALVNYDARIPMGWDRPKRMLEDAAKRMPDSYRVQSLLRLVLTIAALEQNRIGDAIELLKQTAADASRPEFDFELGCNVLHILSRIAARQATLADAEIWVRRIVERFGVSKTSSHFLELTLFDTPNLLQEAKLAMQKVNERTRVAMGYAVNKLYDQSVRELLALAEASLNARVFALTDSFLDRHGSNVSSDLATDAALRLTVLKDTYAAYGTHAKVDVKVRSRT